MKKQIFYTLFILSLIACLPAFAGNAQVSPDQLGNDNLSTNGTYDYDGNTVEIIEQTAQSTVILLNDTYQLEIHHNDTNVGVRATILGATPILNIKADEFLFDVDFTIAPSGKTLDIELPTDRIVLTQEPYKDDVWSININDELFYLTFDSTDKTLNIDYLTSHLDIGGDEIYYTDTANTANNFVLTRLSDDEFLLMTADGLFNVYLNSTDVMVDWVGNMIVQPMGPHLPFQWVGVAPMVAISFVDNCVMVEWEDVTVQILDDMVIMIIDFIVITWYFLLLIEMIAIFIFDITIIFYLAIVELIIVIIYSTIEIKVYETQVVIVYQYIEIIFLFVSILLWEITFIFHFEFWFIQFIFLVNLVTFIIINQVRIILIPVIVPVFIPMIYYVPVIMKQYVYIYLPYASPALYIDVYDEQLAQPTHTIQYCVTDQSGQPVDDAVVSVNYNGLDYGALFVSNGIYVVSLPASNETETIHVTASKSWYPTGHLIYDLDIDWLIGTVTEIITTTETPASPLPLIPILASLFSVAVGTIIYKRRKN
ncbi:MAG: hypothetical protein FK734_13635 [Asgard group archaeon]|nr:hypothetical protein [Asgard group archaeon]